MCGVGPTNSVEALLFDVFKLELHGAHPHVKQCDGLVRYINLFAVSVLHKNVQSGHLVQGKVVLLLLLFLVILAATLTLRPVVLLIGVVVERPIVVLIG